MAKSLRSKSKRSFRSKKRESGIYAATHAARLHRLNGKLLQVAKRDINEDTSTIEEVENGDIPADQLIPESQADGMILDSGNSQPISTHGPRNSRRDEWRRSKGLPARPTIKVMNRQGGLAGKRKAGHSKRRR